MTILKEKTFNTGTVTLNYAEGPPSGPPLLLLPGMARSWKAFLPVIPSLTPDWHVYALDYRGHGKSGRMPGKYKATDYQHGTERENSDYASAAGPRVFQDMHLH